jgi:hypothetical protein
VKTTPTTHGAHAPLQPQATGKSGIAGAFEALLQGAALGHDLTERPAHDASAHPIDAATPVVTRHGTATAPTPAKSSLATPPGVSTSPHPRASSADQVPEAPRFGATEPVTRAEPTAAPGPHLAATAFDRTSHASPLQPALAPVGGLVPTFAAPLAAPQADLPSAPGARPRTLERPARRADLERSHDFMTPGVTAASITRAPQAASLAHPTPVEPPQASSHAVPTNVIAPRSEQPARQALPPQEKAVSARRAAELEHPAPVQAPVAPLHPPAQPIGTVATELKVPKQTAAKGQPEPVRTAGKSFDAKAVVDRTQTFEHLATRAKARHDTHRLATTTAEAPAERPGDKQRADAEKRRDRDDLPLAPPLPMSAGPAPALQPTFEVTNPVVAPAAPSIPAALEAFLPQLQDDPSLRIALMSNTARVTLETPDAGRVSLQLKVKDGVTEVRASGPAAASLELRTNELRVALAGEGLALGHFDLTQSNSQQRHAERPEVPERGPRPVTAATSNSTSAVTHDGRLHVKA